MSKLIIFAGLFILALLPNVLRAQVQLRDTTITWQHHSFVLAEDYGMVSYSQDNEDITEVSFANSKVIENDLIRIVLVPEYGGRVLSYVYKPTGHEYLYQSECGSAYNIHNGIFYYDWLMVWGGIFPTFPEPEHGKTWLLPWEYSVIEETDERVTIRMEYTDNVSFAGAPGGYNKGTTEITCQVDISVYANSSVWDFDVNLINARGEPVIYEYWTCTTLAPGSTPGETGTPLNSQMIIPSEEYFAAWSPGGWIGNYDQTYPMTNIDYLEEWDDMGIAYAHDFQEDYWGVINHDNDEGIFRLSENIETPGVKLWTWGNHNVDNDMFNFSNGGADNYIELWAGASEAFFRDATLDANTTKSWKESYCATTGMTGIGDINHEAAIHLDWDTDRSEVIYEINTFDQAKTYQVVLMAQNVNSSSPEDLLNTAVAFEPLGVTGRISFGALDLPLGHYDVELQLLDTSGEVMLATAKEIEVNSLLSAENQLFTEMLIRNISPYRLSAHFSQAGQYQLVVSNLNGQVILNRHLDGQNVELDVPGAGLYVIRAINRSGQVFVKKIAVR